MKKWEKTVWCFVILVLFVSVISYHNVIACKDIIITPPASAGEYSLFLKVRDPSREGLQVLCRVPQGTSYTYHYPWRNGRPWDFVIRHTFYGVSSQGDVFPNITKAGMVFTDAGLAFGDADTLSNWRNPTKNAWDDFDWMRYAYQTADTVDEAVSLLTSDAVDRLHATGVTENLFVVGPNKAVVIEADILHYVVKEVSDILVMSNYPKDLWRTQLLISLPVSPSYDTTKETWVRQGRVDHLDSLWGIKILSVNQTSVVAKAVPSFAFRPYGTGEKVVLSLGERRTIGTYSVTLLAINSTSAKISLCTAVYAWEQELLNHIQPLTGHITLQDMMGWSRLHSSDLDGLRPLCEDANIDEGAMVYRVPKDHANLLSSGWFAANHPCSSIYVPIHICDDDQYSPYQSGEAAELSLELLHKYGHGTLSSSCKGIESVFLFENEVNELIAHQMIHSGSNITPFLTNQDRGMQEQAFLTEQLWLNEPNASQTITENLWTKNYSSTLIRMKKAVILFKDFSGSEPSLSILEKLMHSIEESQKNQVRLGSIFNQS